MQCAGVLFLLALSTLAAAFNPNRSITDDVNSLTLVPRALSSASYGSVHTSSLFRVRLQREEMGRGFRCQSGLSCPTRHRLRRLCQSEYTRQNLETFAVDDTVVSAQLHLNSAKQKSL